MIPEEAVCAEDIDEWGLDADDEGIYLMDEASARQAANDDLKLVRKVDGEWIEVEA